MSSLKLFPLGSRVRPSPLAATKHVLQKRRADGKHGSVVGHPTTLSVAVRWDGTTTNQRLHINFVEHVEST